MKTRSGRPGLVATDLVATALSALALVFTAVPAGAAEIRVICSNALKTALEEIAPAFENGAGQRLSITWGPTIPLKVAIENGAAFDVTLLTMDAVDDLIRQGRLAADTRTLLVTSRAGLAVRRGSPKPDIATVEAFKRALLAASSIGYVEQGATGAYLKTLLPRLGIADAVKGRVRLLPPENPAAKAVANGEAEIGMTQISEILPYAGAELVGPLPAEIGLTMKFGAAVEARAVHAEAARALLKFLTTAAAADAFRAKGLEPEN